MIKTFNKFNEKLKSDDFYVVYDGKSAYIVSKNEYDAISSYVKLLGQFDDISKAEEAVDKKNKNIKSNRSVWHPFL